MSYQTLGARSATGIADQTGRNPGNWTVTFDTNLINVNVPQFELYKLVVIGSAASATFNVYVNTYQWDTAVYAVNNSWDPQQPLPLRPGDSVYFFYSTSASDGHMPTITAWFRFDPSLQQIYGLV